MNADWFDAHAAVMAPRLHPGVSRVELIVGIRVNAPPHIGTYMILASSFLLASRTSSHFGLPSQVRIDFLDNDPSPTGEVHQGTHFHCVYQGRTAGEAAEFLADHYLDYLGQLGERTDTPHVTTIYSDVQSRPLFRATVLKTLLAWDEVEYYLSGPAVAGRPHGVRSLGFPCPTCGLFNGRAIPAVRLVGRSDAVVATECCHHGEHATSLTTGSAFLNLETSYRNVIKEQMAATRKDRLSVAIKGSDWAPFLPHLDLVHNLLRTPDSIPPRLLLPVVAPQDGKKLSKSAILVSPGGFENIPPFLLDMKILGRDPNDCASRLLKLSAHVLGDPRFAVRPVSPSDIVQMIESPPDPRLA